MTDTSAAAEKLHSWSAERNVRRRLNVIAQKNRVVESKRVVRSDGAYSVAPKEMTENKRGSAFERDPA